MKSPPLSNDSFWVAEVMRLQSMRFRLELSAGPAASVGAVQRALVLLVFAAAFGCFAGPARADPCGIPDSGPIWVDFAGHDAPVPAEPGTILAVSSGTEVPAQMRAAGAATVFFDLNFNKRVGTPTAPADPATIPARAKGLFDFAVSVTGCQTPILAMNELFGAQTATPWSATNAQYRDNALRLFQELQKLGARPAITIANPPSIGGDAAEWWREAAKAAILVRQVYFTAPNTPQLYKLGAVRASRSMRKSLRGLVSHLTRIGIPANRIALELQFQSAPNGGARKGASRKAWLQVIKWEALAAKQVAKEFGIQGVWSWGFATFSAEGADPDKAAAACVWLWARDAKLCDGPKAAGAGFDASLTDGQLTVPRGVRCVLADGRIDRAPLYRLTVLTGDDDFAASVLLERAVLRQQAPVDPVSVVSAERLVVASAFGGSRARYLAALRQAKLPLADARALIADRIARDRIEARFKPRPRSQAEVSDFVATYGGQQARLVQTTPAAPWLGGAERGWAVSSLAPERVFSLQRAARLDTPDGVFRVKPLGPPLPLGLLPASTANAVARATLERLAHADVYARWLEAQERAQLDGATCLRDDLPATGATDVSPFVPFLAGS
jgi:hypothetical protein